MKKSLRRSSCSPVLLAAACLAACGDDSELDADALLAEPMACGAMEHEVCDVFDGACQEQLAAIAACQWGGPGTTPVLPDVVVVTQADVRQNFLSEAAMMVMATDVTGTYDAVLELLGVSSAGDLGAMAQAEAVSEGLGALYDPVTKTITMIEREVDLGDPLENAILLHELVHAQQDAAYDLGALLASAQTSDANIAVRSAWEGEATFHENLFLLGIQGRTPDAATLTDAFAGYREAAEAELFAAPSPFVDTFIVTPYLYGPSWVQNLWVTGGSEAVQGRYSSLPTDSLEVLRAGWGEAASPYEVSEFPLGNLFARPGEPFPAEGSDAYPLAIDRLGAWFVHLAGRLHSTPAEARELALGWRGDQMDLFALDDGRAAARWRVRFETSDQATRFGQLFAGNANVKARQDGVGVYLAVIAGDAPEWLFGPLGR